MGFSIKSDFPVIFRQNASETENYRTEKSALENENFFFPNDIDWRSMGRRHRVEGGGRGDTSINGGNLTTLTRVVT